VEFIIQVEGSSAAREEITGLIDEALSGLLEAVDAANVSVVERDHTYVLMTGDAVNGLEFIGPFPSYDDAGTYGDRHVRDTWVVTRLESPNPIYLDNDSYLDNEES
jgi:hypothetical protein